MRIGLPDVPQEFPEAPLKGAAFRVFLVGGGSNAPIRVDHELQMTVLDGADAPEVIEPDGEACPVVVESLQRRVKRNMPPV